MQLQLPDPSNDAMRASRQLHTLIANEIRRSSGWISFAHYMEMALYMPKFGYYSGGAAKLGKDGDFTTAPEITPLFGATLAQLAAQLMQQSSPQIIEFGAGTGKLARDILTELSYLGVAVERYFIVEVSGELRARQEDTLNGFSQVRWLDQFPHAFSGVVIANEVLDAMPVQLVVKTEEGWRERGVGLAQEKLTYFDKPCDAALIEQIPDEQALPIGYVTEVHPISCGFMRSMGAMLCAGFDESGKGGAAIMIDYGFPAPEYYLDQRATGTFMCHYRHHAHDDPFYLPGLQDITSHIDFTAMARSAIEGGLDVLAYMSQAAFLMGAGIGELLQRTPVSDAMRYLPQANAVQRLISPAEMGELFKTLIVGKHIELPPELLRNDRAHRL